MTILDELAAYARVRAERSKQAVSLEKIKEQALRLCEGAGMRGNAGSGQREERQDMFAFERALSGPDIGFICEVKKASPSKGIIAEDFPYLEIAREYEAAGAECISVLTEPGWFLGSGEYLREISRSVKTPCIRKDFIVDPYMIYEAKVMGASAILLICSLLDTKLLENYISIADSLGMSSLVEAHDEEEIRSAVAAGARMIGVNNRNLKDFTVDIANSSRLRSLVPDNILFVAESGIRNAEDVKAMKEAGADACLVGETLMRSADKAQKLKELRGTGDGSSFHISGREHSGLSSSTGGGREQSGLSSNPTGGREQPGFSSSTGGGSERPALFSFRPGGKERVIGTKNRPPFLKLCGIMRQEDISIINEVMPDYAGFILAEGRKRSISPEMMENLTRELNPKILRTAVFLDQDPEWIIDLAGRDLMDVIQLHGSEDDVTISRIKEKTGKTVIKAFRIDTPSDALKAQESAADIVLLDHGDGGSGEAFDWSLIGSVKRPFILAGGLTPENVCEAIENTNPMGVDVSTGVETAGKKDPDKIRRFVRNVRSMPGR